MSDLFPGFSAPTIDTGEARIFARVGGSGPPVLLIHGFPQTHVMWHRIALRLAERFTVVAIDLRGYGWSSVPEGDGGTRAYSKRAMGADAIRVMEELGHTRFAVVGHDRGGRVAYRLGLDHPGRLTSVSVLDILPTIHVWREIDAGRFPAAHWSFLAGPAPGPETEILKDPVPYFEGLMAKWAGSGDLSPFDGRALAQYRMGFNEPNRIGAFCEDYRAGATVDRAADEADLAAGRTIRVPFQAIWGAFYLTGKETDPLAVWRSTFAPDAVGTQVKGGHFVAEEDPAGVLAALVPFLAEHAR